MYKPDPDIDIEEFKQEPMDVSEILSSLSSETNSLSEFFNSSEPRHKSIETRTEIVYKPDPDIDIEEFKQEPMDAIEMISSLSSETNSLSEPRNISSETGTEIVYKPDPDIDIKEFKQEPMDICDIISSDSDSLVNENLISDQTRTDCP